MKYLINLFPAPNQTVSDKILFFALHYLRYILVITQFVAICVFFFRFKIDQEIIDLREKLSQKESVVLATSQMVDRIRETDLKMTQIKMVVKEQSAFESQYTYAMNKIAVSQILISSISISKTTIQLEGTAKTVDPIKSLYEEFQKEKRFRIVDLSTIEKMDTVFRFSLKLEEFIP